MSATGYFNMQNMGIPKRPEYPSRAKIQDKYHKALEQGRYLEKSLGDVVYDLQKAKKDLEEKIQIKLNAILLGTDGQFPDSLRPAKYIIDVIKFVKEMKEFIDELQQIVAAIQACIQILVNEKLKMLAMVQSMLNSIANLMNQICNLRLPDLPSIPNIFGDLVWGFSGFNLSGLNFNANLSFDKNFAFGMCNIHKPNIDIFRNYPRTVTTPDGIVFGSQIINPPLGGIIPSPLDITDPTFIKEKMTPPGLPPVLTPDFNPFVDMAGPLPKHDKILSNYKLPAEVYKKTVLNQAVGLFITSEEPEYDLPASSDGYVVVDPPVSLRNKVKNLLKDKVSLETIVDSNLNPNIIAAWLVYLSKNREARGGLWVANYQKVYDETLKPSILFLDQNGVSYNSFDPTKPLNSPTDLPLISLINDLSQSDKNLLYWKLSYIEASLLGYTRSSRWDLYGDSIYLSGFSGSDLDFTPTAFDASNKTQLIESSLGEAIYPEVLYVPTELVVQVTLAIEKGRRDILNNPLWTSSNPQYKFVYDQFARATPVDRFSQFWREWNFNFKSLLAEIPYVVPYLVTYWEIIDSAVNPLSTKTIYQYLKQDTQNRNMDWNRGDKIPDIPREFFPQVDPGWRPDASNNGWSGDKFNEASYLERPDIKVLPIVTQMAMLDLNLAYERAMQFSKDMSAALDDKISSLSGFTTGTTVKGFQVHNPTEVSIAAKEVKVLAYSEVDLDEKLNVTSPDTFTIQTSGDYTLTGHYEFPEYKIPCRRYVETYVNGVLVASDLSDNTIEAVSVNPSRSLSLAVGDVIQVKVHHDAPEKQVLSGGYNLSCYTVVSASSSGSTEGTGGTGGSSGSGGGGSTGGGSGSGGTTIYDQGRRFPVGVSSLPRLSCVAVNSYSKLQPIHPEVNSNVVPFFDGVTLQAGTENVSVSTAVIYGTVYSIEDASLNFTVGGLLYVGSGGVLTQDFATVQSTCRWIVSVGRALTKSSFIYEAHMPIDQQAGTGGTGGGAYTHTQSVDSDEWVVVHGLGRYVNTQVYDQDNETIGHDAIFIDLNTVKITLIAPCTGHAICS